MRAENRYAREVTQIFFSINGNYCNFFYNWRHSRIRRNLAFLLRSIVLVFAWRQQYAHARSIWQCGTNDEMELFSSAGNKAGRALSFAATHNGLC